MWVEAVSINVMVSQSLIMIMLQMNNLVCLWSVLTNVQNHTIYTNNRTQNFQFQFNQKVCVKCYKTCRQCTDASYQNCTLCLDGNHLILNTLLSIRQGICCPDNCTQCDDQSNCIKCVLGYFLVESSFEYEKEEYGYIYIDYIYVKKCSKTCPANENIQFEDKCFKCQHPCKTCINYEYQCQTCVEGYDMHPEFKTCNSRYCPDGYYGFQIDDLNYVSTIEQCEPCIDHCKKCSSFGEESSCSQCETGYNLLYQEDGKMICVQNCNFFFSNLIQSVKGPPSTYLSWNKCQSCNYICFECVMEQECTSCADYFYELKSVLIINNIAKIQIECLDQCNEGYYPDQDSMFCKQCPNGCQICLNEDKCDQCLEGYIQTWEYPYLCIHESGVICFYIFEYFDQELLSCELCHISCLSCVNYHEFSCTSCSQPLKLHKGQCLPDCPKYYVQAIYEGDLYYYKPLAAVDQQFVCKKCPLYCEICNSPTICTKCYKGYLLQGQCEQGCSQGQYIDYSRNRCMPCHPACTLCYGSKITQCYSCNIGYFKDSEKDACILQSECAPYYHGDFLTLKCEQCSWPCKRCISFTTDKDQLKIAYLQDPNIIYDYSWYETIQQKQATFCVECEENYFLYQYQCVDICPVLDGVYADLTHQKCLPCPQQCLTCESPDFCLLCFFGLLLSNNKCQEICDEGFVQVSNECQRCHEACATCSVTPENCHSCYLGYFLDRSAFSCVLQSDITTGYYGNVTTGWVESCDSKCSICIGGQDFQCMQCKQPLVYQDKSCLPACHDGFYPLETLYNPLDGSDPYKINECQRCYNTCKTCSDINTCLSCKSGRFLYENQCLFRCPTDQANQYFPSTITNKCELCHISCLDCFGILETQCITCATGLIIKLDQNICVTPEQCTGYGNYLIPSNNQQTCMKCDISCYGSCQNSPRECVGCTQNYFKQGNICVTNCQTGLFYKKETRSCLPCPKNCLSCTGESNCHQCNFENKKSLIYNGKCYDTCPAGTFQIANNEKCQLCDRSCKTCIDSSNKCITCQPNLFLTTDNRCLVQCEDDSTISENQVAKYYNSSVGNEQLLCVLCSGNCKTCQLSNPKYCLTCSNNFYLSEEFIYILDQNESHIILDSYMTCLSECGLGRYIVNNKECAECPLYCSQCDADQCFRCNQNYLLVEGQCFEYCLAYVEFYDTDQNGVEICSQCPVTCLEGCVNSQQCLGCYIGLEPIYTYQKNGQSLCLVECPLGSIPDQQLMTCINCGTNCATCSLEDPSHCFTCLEGSGLLEYSCIESCPPGYNGKIVYNNDCFQVHYYEYADSSSQWYKVDEKGQTFKLNTNNYRYEHIYNQPPMTYNEAKKMKNYYKSIRQEVSIGEGYDEYCGQQNFCKVVLYYQYQYNGQYINVNNKGETYVYNNKRWVLYTEWVPYTYEAIYNGGANIYYEFSQYEECPPENYGDNCEFVNKYMYEYEQNYYIVQDNGRNFIYESDKFISFTGQVPYSFEEVDTGTIDADYQTGQDCSVNTESENCQTVFFYEYTMDDQSSYIVQDNLKNFKWSDQNNKYELFDGSVPYTYDYIEGQGSISNGNVAPKSDFLDCQAEYDEESVCKTIKYFEYKQGDSKYRVQENGKNFKQVNDVFAPIFSQIPATYNQILIGNYQSVYTAGEYEYCPYGETNLNICETIPYYQYEINGLTYQVSKEVNFIFYEDNFELFYGKILYTFQQIQDGSYDSLSFTFTEDTKEYCRNYSSSTYCHVLKYFNYSHENFDYQVTENNTQFIIEKQQIRQITHAPISYSEILIGNTPQNLVSGLSKECKEKSKDCYFHYYYEYQFKGSQFAVDSNKKTYILNANTGLYSRHNGVAEYSFQDGLDGKLGSQYIQQFCGTKDCQNVYHYTYSYDGFQWYVDEFDETYVGYILRQKFSLKFQKTIYCNQYFSNRKKYFILKYSQRYKQTSCKNYFLYKLNFSIYVLYRNNLLKAMSTYRYFKLLLQLYYQKYISNFLSNIYLYVAQEIKIH